MYKLNKTKMMFCICFTLLCLVSVFTYVQRDMANHKLSNICRIIGFATPLPYTPSPETEEEDVDARIEDFLKQAEALYARWEKMALQEQSDAGYILQLLEGLEEIYIEADCDENIGSNFGTPIFFKQWTANTKTE
ncbi:MAG: hypothetical protein EA357_08095 [Micavibrio sp.]|nr:MAG: hypothetical protein EA357_08095 [Micavibrio sp.]